MPANRPARHCSTADRIQQTAARAASTRIFPGYSETFFFYGFQHTAFLRAGKGFAGFQEGGFGTSSMSA
jgi:hypothetical protein